jgi:hypothetical protein
LIGGDAVLRRGVMSGHHKKVGLPCGETGNGSGGGVAGIDALGIDAAGSAVIDIVTRYGGVSLSGPGQGDTLCSLSDGERAEEERSHSETKSGGTSEKGGRRLKK